MKALFDQVTSGPWITSGDDVNYRIEFVGTDATLLFEGTHDDFGWKMNFDFWVKAYKDQPIEWYAHRGFLTMWHSVRDEIMAKLKGATSIHIIGYSQGAALASLALEDVNFSYYSIPSLADVFGSPRVFWCLPKEIEYRVRNISRWYVRGDLVTTVPWAFLGYQHVGMKHPVGPNKFPWWTHHRPVEYDTYLPV